MIITSIFVIQVKSCYFLAILALHTFREPSQRLFDVPLLQELVYQEEIRPLGSLGSVL